MTLPTPAQSAPTASELHPRLRQRALVPGASGTGAAVQAEIAAFQSQLDGMSAATAKTEAAKAKVSLAISEDEGNIATLGEDDGIYVPPDAMLISEDAGNIAELGSDDGVFVPSGQSGPAEIAKYGGSANVPPTTATVMPLALNTADGPNSPIFGSSGSDILFTKAGVYAVYAMASMLDGAGAATRRFIDVLAVSGVTGPNSGRVSTGADGEDQFGGTSIWRAQAGGLLRTQLWHNGPTNAPSSLEVRVAYLGGPVGLQGPKGDPGEPASLGTLLYWQNPTGFAIGTGDIGLGSFSVTVPTARRVSCGIYCVGQFNTAPPSNLLMHALTPGNRSIRAIFQLGQAMAPVGAYAYGYAQDVVDLPAGTSTFQIRGQADNSIFSMTPGDLRLTITDIGPAGQGSGGTLYT